jgi:hypothetical protein
MFFHYFVTKNLKDLWILCCVEEFRHLINLEIMLLLYSYSRIYTIEVIGAQ